MAAISVVVDNDGKEVARMADNDAAWKLENARRFAARVNRQTDDLAELDAKIAKLQTKRDALAADRSATRDELWSLVPDGFVVADDGHGNFVVEPDANPDS